MPEKKERLSHIFHALGAVSVYGLAHFLLEKPITELSKYLSSLLKVADYYLIFDVGIRVVSLIIIFILFEYLNISKTIRELGRLLNHIIKGFQFAFLSSTSFLNLAETWIATLRNPKDKRNKELLRSYLKAYLRQESSNIKDGHYIHTNFLGYSEIVQTLVERANKFIKDDSGKEIVCLTTLVLNPYKWFNFNDGAKGYSINKDWEQYKDFISSIKTHTKILRFVIGYENNRENFKFANSSGLSLTNMTKIEQELDSYICTEKNTFRAVPLKRSQLEQVWSSITNDKLKKFIVKNYKLAANKGQSPLAYLIFPKSYESEISQIEYILDVKCRTLRAVISEQYHRHPIDFKPFYFGTVNDINLLEYYFVGENEIPEDFFVIGIKKDKKETDNKTEWLFGIGADVDKNLDKSKLYFFFCDQDVSERTGAINYKSIEKFIHENLLL